MLSAFSSRLILSKSLSFWAMIALMIGVHTGKAKAEDFNTGFVLNKMPADERIVHIDGLVRGIAFASYFHKNKDNTAFECVLDYALTGNRDKRFTMLDFAKNHAEKPLGGVLFVYLRKKCDL